MADAHEHVCPWWMGYALASPLRRLMVKPEILLAPYLKEGMTALEVGPGMGFFTLPLAAMAGPRGRIVAVDIQRRMLDNLEKRAQKAGLAERIECRLTSAETLGVTDLAGQVDFALAFAVVHELPDRKRFFEEVGRALKSAALLLMSDPAKRFSEKQFRAALELAQEAGFVSEEAPPVRGCRSTVLRKQQGFNPYK